MPSTDTTPHADTGLRSSRYTVRARLPQHGGGMFHVHDEAEGGSPYFAEGGRQLDDEIRLYTDETRQREYLRIRTDSVYDIPGGHDVVDAASGWRIGVLGRGAWHSMLLRDRWTLHDLTGTARGRLEEVSARAAFLRRYVDIVSLFVAQRCRITWDDHDVGRLTGQRYRADLVTVDLELSPDVGGLDRRLALAAAIALSAFT